jgi:long-chain acyl-CoA synthetase
MFAERADLFDVAPVTVKHGPTYPAAFVHAPPTLPDYYNQCFARFAKQEFIVDGDRRLTFAEVRAQAAALATAFQQQYGIKAGDRVGIAMVNSLEWVLAFVAAGSIGAIAVPINSLYKSEKEYEFVISNSGCKVLVCDKSRLATVADLCKRLKVDIITDVPVDAGVPSVQDLCMHFLYAGKTPSPLTTPLDTDDVAVIMYTSGSTGFPKGVMLTHRGLGQQMMMTHAGNTLKAMAYAEAVAAGTPVAPLVAPAIIITVPLFHITALNHIFLVSFAGGRKMVVMKKWDPLTAMQLVQKEQIQVWSGVPTMVADMLEHPDFAKYDLSSLRVSPFIPLPLIPFYLPLLFYTLIRLSRFVTLP